jgi:integrase
MGKEHRQPLSDPAMAALEAMRADQGAVEPDDYVFARGHGRPIADNSLLRLATKIRPGITTHGFRSCLRDWLGDKTDFPRDYAGILEIGQIYVPGRHSQLEDFAASCLGVAIVIAPTFWIRRTSAPMHKGT